MRKLIVLSFLSLDGVMQAPGGPEEDTSGGFKYGGWSFRYGDDSILEIVLSQLDHDYDLVLGRKTYDIFAGYWPKADPNDPIAKGFNKARKYVATHSELNSDWKNSIRIEGNIADGIRQLKSESGPELQVHGSGNLIQTLLKHDLVDELWLKIFPITLGTGKRLFAEGTGPTAFKLDECTTTPSGVVIANYTRKGEVEAIAS